ncbi:MULTISPECIES: fimbria/pilus outer membrane usher protein [unclassified Serratia (in: enterobacteria)]|uniref:fimbria/pilus outer membrane usher protein n=1 Tax=unclassified Serratia (in: enterobacteria) TaxID=2647522 RepID=UPI00068C963A|nr:MULTISPECIES: fimbria/pilus outer membrane usher protein [unclassified Serratia (in: enterobacteria)]
MKRNPQFQLNTLTAFILSVFVVVPATVWADETVSTTDSVTFDPIFLSPGAAKKANLKRFEKGATALPGTYSVSIFINDMGLGYEDVTFKEDEQGNVNLCLLPSMLRKMNFNTKELPAQTVRQIQQKSDECVVLKTLLPDASIDYDSGTQHLDLVIPQAYLRNMNNAYVSPEYWDDGVNALMLGYQSNFYSMFSHGKSTDSAYVGLSGGLNIGAWKLRHNGNYNWMQGSGGTYQRINSYVERDISTISGRLIVGENNTSGNVFDSVAYRGVELKDVERMRPQSERGYAPEVRGIARTNATVTVRQNGQIIRETTVAPGAFNIDDLYPNGYGGDLEVTVTEADGSVQHFNVPYAAVSQLLRPGSHHYDMVIGEFNDTRASKRRLLYQATYQRGLTNMFTGYGGVQSSKNDYYTLQLGTAMNTFIGALAFDVSQSKTNFSGNTSKGDSLAGQSYRVSYSKFVPETKSNFSVAAYRYSTSGYLNYRTAMLMIDEVENGRNPENIYRPKNRFTTTLNQGLPSGYGQFYVTGYTQDYWNKGTGSDLQYQLGYNNNFKSVAYGLNAGRSRNGLGNMETIFMFNMSMPLGSLSALNTPNMTASFSRDGSGNYGQQVGVSGTAGKEHQYSYGATASHYNNGTGNSSNLNGQYRSSFANLNAAVSKGLNYHSMSAGASGTLLAYSGGLVATPYTSDTFAIVEAKGATGATVGNYTGVKVDSFGHAAVPYLNPYEMNEVSLDPKGSSQTIELKNTSQRVAPYAGSVVHLKYETRKGYPLLLHLNKGNIAIPFGAEVTDTKGNGVGVVGQGGEVYARVEARSDILHVQWGFSASEQCNIHYDLTDTQVNSENLIQLSAMCTN